VRAEQHKVAAELVALRSADRSQSVNARFRTPIVNEVYLTDPIVQQKQRDSQAPRRGLIQKDHPHRVPRRRKEPSLKPYLDQRDALHREMATRRTEIKQALEQQARGKKKKTSRPRTCNRRSRRYRIAAPLSAARDRRSDDEIRSLRSAAAAVVVVPPPPPVVRVENAGSIAREGARSRAEIRQVEAEGLEPFLGSFARRKGQRWTATAFNGRPEGSPTSAVAAGALIGLLLVGFVEFRTRRVTACAPERVRWDWAPPAPLQVFGALPHLRANARKTLADDGQERALRWTPCARPSSERCRTDRASSSSPVPAKVKGKSALANQTWPRAWPGRGNKTILIDADPRRSEFESASPALPKARGLGGGCWRGENRGLRGPSQPTTMNRLWVMPAGRGRWRFRPGRYSAARPEPSSNR